MIRYVYAIRRVNEDAPPRIKLKSATVTSQSSCTEARADHEGHVGDVRGLEDASLKRSHHILYYSSLLDILYYIVLYFFYHVYVFFSFPWIL